MKYSKLIVAVASVIVMLGFSACGGGSDGGSGTGGGSAGGSDTNGTTTTTGYLIDSPIAGVSYECGDKNGITDNQGKFECDEVPIVFRIGSLIIGQLNSFTADNKVYPQDLLGLSRNNFTDEKLIALTRLLQSLDDDGNYTQTINIVPEKTERFTDDEEFDESKLDDYANAAGVNLVSKETAIRHLKKNMKNTHPGEISIENVAALATFQSDVLTFNDAFLGESDDSRYYALACSQATNPRGQDVAHFDLLERHFTPTTMNHQTIDNANIFVMDKRLFVDYSNDIVSEYVNLADVFSLIWQAALVAIDTTYKGHKSIKTELWFQAGNQFPGSSDIHSPCDGTTWRDIDSIFDIWYNTRGGENLWSEMHHELVGANCLDLDIWGDLFDMMQLEVTEQTKDDECGTYYLNQ